MSNDARLYGIWLPDPLTPHGELLSVEFQENGSLLYTIEFEGEQQTLVLLYEADGEILTTRDEFAGVLASSSYQLLPDDSLQLSFGGTKYVYRRIS